MKGEEVIWKHAFFAILFAGVASAAHSPVEITSPHPLSESEWITYTVESPVCICWEGIFRGTWYNIDDFYPGSDGWQIEQIAIWFDHSVSYPWDVSQLYAEIWTGDQSGPVSQFSQELTTAIDGGPTIVSYPSSLVPGRDFWVIINTEFSSGGWPSNLGDTESPMTESHSFNSDDFVNWEPWLLEGDVSNYTIYVDVFSLACEPLTWAALKTVF